MDSLNLSLTRSSNLSTIILMLILVGGSVIYLFDYLILDVNVLIGACLLPLIMEVRKGDHSMRYLIPSILFTGLAILIPVKTMIFLAAVFSLFLLIESQTGKINFQSLVLLFTVSPLFKFATGMFSFPVRLKLSQFATDIFQLAGSNAYANGNVIVLNGQEFSVDPACAGLTMMGTSLILTLLFISFSERKYRRTYSIPQLLFIITGTFILNIIANLFRILMLITFKIGAEDPFHDLAGIMALILYVLLPLYFLTNKIYKPGINPEGHLSAMNRHAVYLNVFILSLLCISMIRSEIKALEKTETISHSEIIGFRKQLVENGIIKFENETALVYVKPLQFYNAEHNPMICWKGSGYEFRNIKEELVRGKPVYTGIISNGKDELHTAWWFDNGKVKTNDQLEWRWSAIREGGFSLVNVSAATKEELQRELQKLIAREEKLN